jgi:hypothetical protein
MNEGMQRTGGLRTEQARLKISDAIGPGQSMVPSDASQNVSFMNEFALNKLSLWLRLGRAAHIQSRIEIGNLLVTTWTRIALVSSRDLS